MRSCPRSPKLTLLNLGPRSLPGWLFIPSFCSSGLACRACRSRSQLGMKLACPAWLILMLAPYPENHIIARYILGRLKLQVSCLAINADYNKKSYVCHTVCHGIDWQNWRQKPAFINKKHNKTILFMHKIEYFTCNQRSINPFISNQYWHFWVQI